MQHTPYISLTRQIGLLREMQIIANNIANSSTTGFRQEGVVFSEYVNRTGGSETISMAYGNAGGTSNVQGGLSQTNAELDFAIEGDGFFLIETPNGDRLTRAGSFSTNEASELVTAEGYRVMGVDRAPIFIPSNDGRVRMSTDGTLSVEGRLFGQVGVFSIEGDSQMRREAGVRFIPNGDVEPLETVRVLQGV